MTKKTGRNNKTEHVLNLLTARKEPEYSDERTAEEIRQQLEKELQQEEIKTSETEKTDGEKTEEKDDKKHREEAGGKLSG